MSHLDKLRNCSDLLTLSRVLGIKHSALAYIMYHMPDNLKYEVFDIPKRGGGCRRISAPVAQLKMAQGRLDHVLRECWEEIAEKDSRKYKTCHGFVSGKSIITNAFQHTGRRFVVNIDIEGFFDSINFGRVRGFFIKDKYFCLDKFVATAIAQIACYQNKLPQGSPSSPIISNLVGSILDVNLSKFSRKHRLRYTRYVDDITFSTNERLLPSALGSIDNAGVYDPGQPLIDLFLSSGFILNIKKCRAQARGSRQTVTGLCVNQKVNITQAYFVQTRAMVDRYVRLGYAIKHKGFAVEFVGPLPKMTTLELQGRLSHIFNVKIKHDERRIEEQHSNQTGQVKVFRKFLFAKNFVFADKPLLLCEGKTDSVYLRNAIMRLPAYHPALGAWNSKKFESKIDYFNYSESADYILRLAGGSSFFHDFIMMYKTYYGRSSVPAMFPVIMLLDNDGGLAPVINACAKKATMVVKPNLTTTDDFYYVGDNLYIVKTIELGATKTKIEDFFEPHLLSIKLDGKKFNPDKKHNAPGEYGKAVFASEVIAKNASIIDFTKFGPILKRIIYAIDDYALRLKSNNFC